MPKFLLLKAILLIAFPFTVFSQCITALPVPACTGSEPLINDGDVLSGGSTKWYYGGVAFFNTLTVDGGTLVVCGDLTIDKFYMNTGKIFIRPGARLVIGSGIGAGLEFKGDCAIYNYGTCQIQRNLSLENNATATTPNIIVNALSSSVFLMSNQYFVIGNSSSWFVNNGKAEFWGIITDQQSVASSVCLGNGSSTKMAVLINKVANTYAVPSGSACLNVYQFSEFYGQLTSSASLMTCLGSAHSSNSSCIPFGCRPNYWGASQLFTNCSGCATINLALSVQFISLSATSINQHKTQLQWETDVGNEKGAFIIYRSNDGKQFLPIDSIFKEDNRLTYNYTENQSINDIDYYMIKFINTQTGNMIYSKIIKVISTIKNNLTLFPVPFFDKFSINYEDGTIPNKISLKDVQGRLMRIRSIVRGEANEVDVIVLDKIPAGLYIIQMETNKSIITRPILKY
ncbi:MAG: T9SS type A sorting domain-containing protein [Chitinophagaceae bacterium]